MIRVRNKSENNDVFFYKDPVEYVKNVFDSLYYAGIHWTGYPIEGSNALISIFKSSKNQNEKGLIEKAIVELLDDPDYACDAIPAAAELGLKSAHEWFLNLSKKSIEELREIKTTSYVNGFYCLMNYTDKDYTFLEYLKDLIENKSLTNWERLTVLNKIGKIDPQFIFQNYNKYISNLFNNWDKQQENTKKFLIYELFCKPFEKLGLEKCIDVAKELKENCSEDIQELYFESLNPLPAYKDYMGKVKEVLELD